MITDKAMSALHTLLGERFEQGEAVRFAHGRDESWHAVQPPDAVAFPQSTEEVSAIMKICATHAVPVVPFGAGTSLEGGVSAVRGGLALDLMGMNRVLAVHAQDMDVHVEAGVTRKALNEYLRDTGLFFSVDPGADASLGGMASTRASGTNAVRYGTMRDNVLNLTVVLASGEVIRTGGRARKSAAGYDLTRLFVGAEGTLGIITELTLRLQGQPEAVAGGICPFPTLDEAIGAVIETIQSGLQMARIEFLDDVQVRACNAYSKLSLPETPVLFLEFHGTPAAVAEQSDRFSEIAQAHGGGPFTWSGLAEERTRLWEARHNAYYAARALAPGKEGMTTDVCVPISHLAQCLAETKADLSASFLTAPIVGHVGDGNFHTIMLVDPSCEAEMAEATRLHDRMVRRALAFEGTCTGEHGIGLGKMHFLEEELGRAVHVLRDIKQALDPDNLMNPGKIVPL
ncbi:MAG: FAD-binding oxidoreductase [Rhodobiaceae bacterium]|nr:FAD-binding oxidoreductase [Rhodobiaceae bacterium]